MKKPLKLRQILSLLLVLALLLQIAPTQALAQGTTGDTVDTIQQHTEPLAVDGEVTSLRTQTEKHYRMSDGSYIVVDYGTPVHYADSDGSWEDIDNTLTEVSTFGRDGASVYTAVNGDEVKAFASEFIPNEPLFSSQIDDYGVTMSLLQPSTMQAGQIDLNEEDEIQFSSSEAIVLNASDTSATYTLEADEEESIAQQVQLDKLYSTVVYPDILPGVDLQYDLMGQNIKETILVNETQTSYAYDFNISLTGLTPAMQTDGSILLNNAQGEAIYQIPTPYMTDAAGNYSDAVEYTVEQTTGGIILTVTADADWINAAERTLPVAIDPALIVITGSLQTDIISTYTDEDEPNSTKYGSQMYLGSNYGKANHGYLYFAALPEIPANCSVVNATISLYKMGYDNGGINSFYGVMQPVTAGIPVKTDTSDYATWLRNLTWNGALELSLGEVEDYALLQPTDSGAYITWNITRSVTQWYNVGEAQSRGNRFMAFKPQYSSTVTATNYAWAAFWTNTNNPAKVPLFIVSYRNDVGVEGRFTYQSVSAGRAGAGYIGDYTGQLTWANTLAADGSTTLPFALSMYHNSANKDTDFIASDTYGIHTADYTTMRTGLGWKLSIQESIVETTVATDSASITYYVYQDGDGTEHYFEKTSTLPYKDDEGLGLELTVSSSTYTLKDKDDNEKIFYNGYLVTQQDSNGNALHYLYNGNSYAAESSTWKPTATGANKVTSIVRVNNIGSKTPETVCTLTYSGTYVSKVVDSMGRTTTFHYDSAADTGRRITFLTMPDGQTVHYTYTTDNCIEKAYDNEAKYGLQFTYRVFQGCLCVQAVKEYAAETLHGTQTIGNAWHCWMFSKNHKEYRFYGNDQTKDTADDIVTRYTFDYVGRTVNATNLSGDKEHILGIAANAYITNSGTSDTNNRLLGAAAMGSVAVNLLNNHGFEKFESFTDDTSQYAWIVANYGSGVSSMVIPVTGVYDFARTGQNCVKMSVAENQLDAAQRIYTSIYQKVYLTAGKTYTFSGYVDTHDVTQWKEGGGVFLSLARDSDGLNMSTSRVVNYAFSNDIAGGWIRLETNYTPEESGWYRARVYLKDAAGEAYVDDLQVEEVYPLSNIPNAVTKAGASSYNLLSVGSFELWNSTTADHSLTGQYWTLGAGASLDSTEGKAYDANSLKLEGDILGKRRASQTIPLNCSGATTFILSGWGKATSVPNCVPSVDMEENNVNDERFFGLMAELTYDDMGSTKEYHFVSFDERYTDWQYASGYIAPKETAKILSSITVYAVYDHNANTAWFDNIALNQEPAQTYTYNEDGNMTSVVDAASGEEAYEYEGANLKEYISNGSGTYKYDYDASNNLTKAWNDGVGTNTTYDTAGNATGTKLSQVNDEGEAVADSMNLQTSAVYTPDGNYVDTVTDANGGTAKYTYYADGSVNTTTINGTIQTRDLYEDNSARLQQSVMTDMAAVQYSYSRGMLAATTRKAFHTDITGTTTLWQRYAMTYDEWGNTTQIKVQSTDSTTSTLPTDWNSGIVLALYGYYGENGLLQQMTYGNGDSLIYYYDLYGRPVRILHRDDQDTLTAIENFYYNGNGNVSRIDYQSGTGVTKESYFYEYDSLGRMIHSRMEDGNGNLLLQIEYVYDGSNRLSKQNYSFGGIDFSETFSYNNDDGSLSSVRTANGDTVSYTYDVIKRLESMVATSGNTEIYTKTYTYQAHANGGNQSTNRISAVTYDKAVGDKTFHYTYDALGNIVSFNENSNMATTYEYDDLGQLVEAYDPGADLRYLYTYDTAGNIRKVKALGEWHSEDDYENIYTYDNAYWKDLLTDFNGQAIAYEGQTYNADTNTVSGDAVSGNPISYYNGTRWTFSWEDGRKLVSASSTGNTISYGYDLNGVRDSKTVNGVEHKYYYASGKLLRETYGTNTLDFIYDSNGNPYALKYNGNTYYYITNLQGDVMYMVDANGATVATYEYDPYGKVIKATGAMAEINPLRYRGYYYDTDTGFYYLQSRYYDPEICRFINADGLASTGQGFLGYNMFAYCNNNPVNYNDPTGYALTFSCHINMEDKRHTGYSSMDDAAEAFGRRTLGDSSKWDGIKGTRTEYGAVLYYTVGPNEYLYYRFGSTQIGEDGLINPVFDPNPFGGSTEWVICGFVHTHPDSVRYSSRDKRAHNANRKAVAEEFGTDPKQFASYVISFSCIEDDSTLYIYSIIGDSKTFSLVNSFRILFTGGGVKKIPIAVNALR